MAESDRVLEGLVPDLRHGSGEYRSLRERLEACRPKTLPKAYSSLREKSEDRAAHAFRAGVAASKLTGRAVGRRLGLSERYIRDLLDGTRAVHVWMGLALPRPGAIAFIEALIVPVEELELEEEPEVRNGTEG